MIKFGKWEDAGADSRRKSLMRFPDGTSIIEAIVLHSFLVPKVLNGNHINGKTQPTYLSFAQPTRYKRGNFIVYQSALILNELIKSLCFNQNIISRIRCYGVARSLWL